MDLRQQVFDLLSDWRGLDSLKTLFWSKLNYDRANQPLPRRDWTEPQREALVEDPLLFATAGQEDSFHLLYCRLASPVLRLTEERTAIDRLLREHPYSLFLFSDRRGEHWHFVNVKDAARTVAGESPHPSRRVLRRLSVGPYERVRTAAERLVMLDVGKVADSSPLEVQARHDAAFDVEAVTSSSSGSTALFSSKWRQ